MARQWRTGAALPTYARIARTIRRTITITVAALFVILSVHTAVTWPNPLGVGDSIVFGLWLAWRIFWRVFLRRYVRQRGMDDPGW